MKHLFKVLTLFSVVSVVLMVSSCPHKNEPEPTPAPTPTPTPSTTISVTGVKLNYTQIYREQGESFILTATVEPANASNKTVTWTTSNGSIATVDNGTVIMTSSTVWESATITATTEDGGKTATCTVTVIQKPTASAPDANGFVTISAGSMPLNIDGSYHVTLTKSYMICDHEVTQKEWMGSDPSSFSSNPASDEVQENRPVENITWYEAIAYCNERTKKEDLKRGSGSGIDYVYFSDDTFTTPYTTADASSEKLPYMRVDANGKIDATGYRLPTEAEWEIAARGGLTGDVYAGTDDVNKLGDYAWYFANSEDKTHEVKKKQSNGYGLYDMGGNVWEWCWDWYGSYAARATDPTGAASGSSRVARGGGWLYYASYCRASGRYPDSPNYRNFHLGFRLARSSS